MKEKEVIMGDDSYQPHFTKEDLKKMSILSLSDGLTWHTDYLKGISEMLYCAFTSIEVERLNDLEEPMTKIFHEMGERVDLIKAMGDELFNRAKSA